MRKIDDLKSWSKNGLIREVRRLRAIVHEHSRALGDTPPGEIGDMVDVHGDPFGHGGVVLDVREAVLMDHVDVAVMDPYTEGKPTVAADKLLLALMLSGRINHEAERSRVIYLFDADGAAAIIVELLSLGERGGTELNALIQARIAARLDAQPSAPTGEAEPDGVGSPSSTQPQEEPMEDDQQEPQEPTTPGDAAQGAADAAQGAADAAGAAEPTPEPDAPAESEPEGDDPEPEAA